MIFSTIFNITYFRIPWEFEDKFNPQKCQYRQGFWKKMTYLKNKFLN